MQIPDYIDANFLNSLERLAQTPCFLYDERILRKQASEAKQFPSPFGLFPRFAMKSCPTRAILQILLSEGFGIDASSGYEVDRALRAGFAAEAISLSTQEFPQDFAKWVELGVKVNACSLSQLRSFGSHFRGTRVGLRFNPGLGSGGTAKTNVGGTSSSFGIWHEKKEEVHQILEEFSLTAERIHTHIGSGSDPAVWQRTAQLSLDLVDAFPDATILNLGGGYKVARTENEIGTDIIKIAKPISEALSEFAKNTGRKISLEIEPGTYLMANAGFLVSQVQDIVDTGENGHRFLKLDSGMTEILRPSLYAAQHPMTVVPRDPSRQANEDSFVVVGHCCESGDLLSPLPEDAEGISERHVLEPVPGDWIIIGGAGAYCGAMSAKNYNSFPEAAEVLRGTKGELKVIRKRQTLDQILANEI